MLENILNADKYADIKNFEIGAINTLKKFERLSCLIPISSQVFRLCSTMRKVSTFLIATAIVDNKIPQRTQIFIQKT